MDQFSKKVRVPPEYRKFYNLLKDHYSPEDRAEIRKAAKFINSIVENQVVEPLTPLFSESLSVAQIVAEEIGLGKTSVICSLFYKFVENEIITSEAIKKSFGVKVAELISSLIKISEIQTKKSRTQAENFRELILTIATDVRVILIKIADRLFLMRTLDGHQEEKRLKCAFESFYLYAPLAHRLGLYNIKSEMEDLSMKYTDAEQYEFITNSLKESSRKRNKFIKDFLVPVQKELNNLGIKYEIKSRTKSIYSIWNKMKKQNIDFDEVFDLFAIRIIIYSRKKKEKADCWRVYSVVTDIYQPNPKRLRDWISIPKTNGYESLHTTVVVPGGKWVEVQIRSNRMDEIAEKGFAAHWKYKEGGKGAGLDEWLAKVRDMLEATEQDTRELMEDFELNLYTKEVFVFTPQGDLKKFPKNAAVLDFAFDIHTDLGFNCVGAKINGRNVPIRYILKNGDKVEILTAKNQKPKQDWLDFVVTSKAKSKIKQSIKEEVFKEAEQGKEILKRRLKNWKIEYGDTLVRKLLKQYKLKTALDLYSHIASGKIELQDIKDFLKSDEGLEAGKPDGQPIQVETEKPVTSLVEKADDYLIIDEKIENIHYQLAKCCNPIFGDQIFGFVTVGEGIKIHRMSCPNASRLLSRYGYRVVKARWAQTEKGNSFQTSIRLSGVEDIGIVGRISDLLAKDSNVSTRSISMDTSNGEFTGTLKLLVRDKDHLSVLIKKLLKVKGVLSASRTE